MSPHRSSSGAWLDHPPLENGGPGARLGVLGLALLTAATALAIAAALVGAPAGTAAPEDVAGSVQAAPAFPGGNYFVVTCGFSHRSNDDPILFPGQPGRSHSHTFVGNRTVSASSTPESLVGGPSSCDSAADSSGYWVPTIFAGRDPVAPLAAIVYYVRRTQTAVAPIPAGLMMVAGDQDARTRQPKGRVSWSCGAIGAPPRVYTPPTCTRNRFLQLQVTFPNCWNGTALDSPDHKRHLVYSSGGRCRASHPVALPTIALVVLYPPVRSPQVASGRLGGHADFMNGWDQTVLERLVSALNPRQR